jgi:hypothetical protein
MSDAEQVQNVALQEGGKRRKAAAKKPKVAAKKPKSRAAPKKKGGAVMDDVKNLVVPFAILLAKQGLQSLYENKSGDVGITASPKKSASATKSASTSVRVAKPASATKSASSERRVAKSASATKSASKKQEEQQQQQRQRQQGGSCTACQSPTITGGNGKSGALLKKNYSSLAKKIDEFLSRY